MPSFGSENNSEKKVNRINHLPSKVLRYSLRYLFLHIPCPWDRWQVTSRSSMKLYRGLKNMDKNKVSQFKLFMVQKADYAKKNYWRHVNGQAIKLGGGGNFFGNFLFCLDKKVPSAIKLGKGGTFLRLPLPASAKYSVTYWKGEKCAIFKCYS